jgi:hypothetical protein
MARISYSIQEAAFINGKLIAEEGQHSMLLGNT